MIKTPAPWIPQGKLNETLNHPKAEAFTRENLAQYENQMKSKCNIPDKEATITAFQNFKGVSYSVLQTLNEKEGDKAMRWAFRQKKKLEQSGKKVITVERFDDTE